MYSVVGLKTLEPYTPRKEGVRCTMFTRKLLGTRPIEYGPFESLRLRSATELTFAVGGLPPQTPSSTRRLSLNHR
jgi:hypothetical protein